MRSWEQLEGETLTDFPLWRGIVIKAPQVGPHDGDEDEHEHDDDGEDEDDEAFKMMTTLLQFLKRQ